jgi:hypothetical protein
MCADIADAYKALMSRHVQRRLANLFEPSPGCQMARPFPPDDDEPLGGMIPGGF